jgi:hypothetical protein
LPACFQHHLPSSAALHSIVGKSRSFEGVKKRPS